ncbi:unnamed protein product [Colias eurytheme]|nr:unnamed protein product [Colias eurytheme]
MMVNTFPFCEESKLRDKVIWRCTSKKTNCKARIHMLEAFFLPSRAGKSVLIFRSNKFWVNNQYRDKLNWACRDKDAKGCLCRVQTTLNGRFIRIKGGHNHEPNFTPQNFDAPTPAEKHFSRVESACMKYLMQQ